MKIDKHFLVKSFKLKQNSDDQSSYTFNLKSKLLSSLLMTSILFEWSNSSVGLFFHLIDSFIICEYSLVFKLSDLSLFLSLSLALSPSPPFNLFGSVFGFIVHQNRAPSLKVNKVNLSIKCIKMKYSDESRIWLFQVSKVWMKWKDLER